MRARFSLVNTRKMRTRLTVCVSVALLCLPTGKTSMAAEAAANHHFNPAEHMAHGARNAARQVQEAGRSTVHDLQQRWQRKTVADIAEKGVLGSAYSKTRRAAIRAKDGAVDNTRNIYDRAKNTKNLGKKVLIAAAVVGAGAAAVALAPIVAPGMAAAVGTKAAAATAGATGAAKTIFAAATGAATKAAAAVGVTSVSAPVAATVAVGAGAAAIYGVNKLSKVAAQRTAPDEELYRAARRQEKSKYKNADSEADIQQLDFKQQRKDKKLAGLMTETEIQAAKNSKTLSKEALDSDIAEQRARATAITHADQVKQIELERTRDEANSARDSQEWQRRVNDEQHESTVAQRKETERQAELRANEERIAAEGRERLARAQEREAREATRRGNDAADRQEQEAKHQQTLREEQAKEAQAFTVRQHDDAIARQAKLDKQDLGFKTADGRQDRLDREAKRKIDAVDNKHSGKERLAEQRRKTAKNNAEIAAQKATARAQIEAAKNKAANTRMTNSEFARQHDLKYDPTNGRWSDANGNIYDL